MPTVPGVALPTPLPTPFAETAVAGGPPPPPPVVYLVRTPGLRVLIAGVQVPALAAVCSYGFDRRYAEARITMGPSPVPISVTYWDTVEVYADAMINPPTTLRFVGRVRRVPTDLWPRTGTILCAGTLYQAERYRNVAPATTIAGSTIWPGGTDLVGAVLTGTVDKTAGSATLTGTGTLFTTELSAGDVIAVRGGTTERRTVSAIASDTSLTVSAAYDYDSTGEPFWLLGATDETQAKRVLTGCGVPYTAANIGGTGVALGTQRWDFDLTSTGPFTWQDQESGLAYLERLDEVCIAQDGGGNWGQYQTFETLAGEVFRTLITTNPQLVGPANADLYEGVDILEGSSSDHSTDDVANRIIAEGADPLNLGTTLNEYVLAAASPYLPASFPNGPDGYPEVTYRHPQNPMLEKRLDADAGSGISAETMAHYLLARLNAEVVTAEIVTHRDDAFGPGQTVYVYSPQRLGIFQRMWLRALTLEVSDQGVFTQRLSLEVRN